MWSGAGPGSAGGAGALRALARRWSAAVQAEPLERWSPRSKGARRGTPTRRWTSATTRRSSGSLDGGARAPRPARRAGQQRRRAVPEPGGGDLPQGLRTVIELNVVGTWLMTHAAATKAFIPQDGARSWRHPLAAQRDAGDGPLRGRPGRGREHDADALDRVGALRHQPCALAAGSSAPRRCGPSTRRRWSRPCLDRSPRPARHRGGDGVADRLPRLARGRLLLGHDHHRRRPRQLVRPWPPGRANPPS